MANKKLIAALVVFSLIGCSRQVISSSEASIAIEWFFNGANMSKCRNMPVRVTNLNINDIKSESDGVVAISVDYSVSPYEEVVAPTRDEIKIARYAKDSLNYSQTEKELESHGVSEIVCNAVRFELLYPLYKKEKSSGFWKSNESDGGVIANVDTLYRVKNQKYRLTKMSQGWRVVTPSMELRKIGPGYQKFLVQDN